MVLQLIAVAALPLTWHLCRRLPDRGYALAKPFGLMLVTYLAWLGASFGFLRNSLGGIALALLLVAGVSAWLLWRDGSHAELMDWLRQHGRLILITEVLFAAALAILAYYRAFDPAISATEKPMELMFLNSVLRSERFPPLDAWLSGYSISYYYFGYVMLAVLTQLSGLTPAFSFNVGLATWFALVALTAFSVGFNLAALLPSTSARSLRASILSGLLAAIFVVVMGNQQGILEFAYHNRVLPAETIKALDIKEMTDNAPTGQWYVGEYWWWWHASRVIHDRDLAGNTIEVIDEFPNFSFILGDMHPHVLALPFVIMAVGFALNLMLSVAQAAAEEAGGNGEPPGKSSIFNLQSLHGLFPLGSLGILLYALALGGLSFLNTWDFPIYLGLTVTAFGVALAQRRGAATGMVFGRSAALGALLAVAGVVLYLPFYLGFQSQAGGLLPNLLFPTRLSQYVVIFAPFLVAALAYAIFLTLQAGASVVVRRSLAWLPWTLGLPAALVLLMLLLARVVPSFQTFVNEVLTNPAVQAQTGGASVSSLLGLVLRLRLANPWTFLFLAAFIAWLAGLLSAQISPREASAVSPSQSAAQPLVSTFALLLVGLALLLTFAPEFIYLKDNFGTRMNTVFKFYYQGWTLLALATAFIVASLWQQRTLTPLRGVALTLIGLLTLTGLYYPVAAGYSKAGRFAHTPTLDGLAYLRQVNAGDYAAIQWLNRNASDARVVLEASGSSYDRDGAGRYSMSTGIPTLLGWDGHEAQWRGRAYGDMAMGRTEAIEAIYRTATANELDSLLNRWGVDYIVVGQLERNKYRLQPTTLTRLDRALDLVYDQDGVRIYRRRGPIVAQPPPIGAAVAAPALGGPNP
jgi:YYY domain-containing protein